jgi:hypothetical protein
MGTARHVKGESNPLRVGVARGQRGATLIYIFIRFNYNCTNAMVVPRIKERFLADSNTTVKALKGELQCL